MDVAKRVGEKVAQGVPLRYALAVEKNPAINLDSWHKAIQRNKNFRDEYDKAHAAFIVTACERLVGERDAANLRWILERRHPADFGRRVEVEVKEGRTYQLGDTVYPEEDFNRIIEAARQKAQETMHANGG